MPGGMFMLRLLARLLIRDSQNTSDPRVREQYGTLASIVGIVLNLILGLFSQPIVNWLENGLRMFA